MTDAPELIWALKPDIFDNVSVWQDEPSPNGDAVEYVRADLHEAQRQAFQAYYDVSTARLEERIAELEKRLAELQTAIAEAIEWIGASCPEQAADELRAVANTEGRGDG